MSHHLAIKKKVINKNCSIITFQLDGQAWGWGGSLVQRGASLSSQEGYFPLQVFLGKTRDLRGGASSSATRTGRGKTQPGFWRSVFLLLFIGSHFGRPLPGWGATLEGLRGAGMGLACVFPGSLSQGPKLFFQVLFQDTLISSIPALAAWWFFLLLLPLLWLDVRCSLQMHAANDLAESCHQLGWILALAWNFRICGWTLKVLEGCVVEPQNYL